MDTIIIVVVALITVFFLFQFWIIRKTKSKIGKELHGIRGEIGEAIMKSKKLLIYFYSPNCSACKTITPVIEEFRKTNPSVYSVDLSKNFELGRQFGIMATPTTLIIENQVVKDVLIGSRSRHQLEEKLKI